MSRLSGQGRLRCARLLLVLVLVATSGRMCLAAEPDWPKGPYQYLIIDQDLREVLVEFGRNIRVPIKISEAIAGRRVRNDVALHSARDFLQRLCDAYGLVWYFDGAVLHVSDENEVRTELINLSSVDAGRLRTKLDALGMSDARYGVRASNDSNVIAVAGPPPYLALVKSAVSALQKDNAPRPVREITDGDALNVRIFRGTRQGS